MTANSLRRKLVLDISGSNTPIKPGRSMSVPRKLTLYNRSDRAIHVDLWIEPSDAKASPLQQWCEFDDPKPTIPSMGRKEVELSFRIPSQAEPGFYSYDVCAQTQEYIDQVERRPQQLEILASDQEITLRNEPVFYLEPPTRSEQPYQLKAGSTFTIKVAIENRSKRVDRLFLTCPELPSTWFDVAYPEDTLQTSGQITQTNGLQLNPNSSGIITLHLHPPHLTPAGHYSTTLRLTSNIQDSLVLLDILYFTIQVNDQIQFALEPKVGHVPGDDSEFGVTVQNVGNIHRDLTLYAYDGDRIFRYAISPDGVELAPGEMAQLLVTPNVRKWWRRQWKKRQDVPFKVEVANTVADLAPSEETQVLSAPTIETQASLPAVPKPLDGKIIWESRPAWLRWLLIIALLLGITAIIYWLVKLLVINPSVQPKVLEFSTPSESVKAENENPIQLDWEVNHSDKLAALELTFFSREDKVEQIFPIPLDSALLQESCKTDIRPVRPIFQLLYRLYGEDRQTPVLICQGVQIRPSEMEVLSSDISSDVPSEDDVVEDDAFKFGVGAYDVTLRLYTSDSSPVNEDASLSPEAETDTTPPTASAVASQSLTQSDTKKIRNIQITPADPPEILYFYSKSVTYREQTAQNLTRALSESGSAEADDLENTIDSSPPDVSAQFPVAPVELTWIIERPWEIEALELSYIAVTAGGAVLSDRFSYPMVDNIPVGIGNQCRLDDNKLICEDVPTTANTAGEYTFNLNVVMPADQNREEISQEADPIEVRPPFPSILSFTINGKQAADHPQQVHLINPARGGVDVMLEWEVENPDEVQVELLPAPGLVDPTTTRMPYTLSPTPGNTNLTLQVTNEAGETVSRSVVIATAAPSSTPSPILPVPMMPPSGIPLPPPPNVLQPSDLEPIQLPPSGN